MEEGGAGHGGRFGEAKHFKEGGGHIGEDAVRHLELASVGRDVEAVDEVGGVGGVGRAVGLEHLFAVPVVCRDERLAAFF